MRKTIALLAVMMLILSAGAAFAANLTLKVESVTFSEGAKQDLVGAGNTQQADGKTDAAFNLSVSGAQAIKQITLKNDTSGKTWSSSPSGAAELLLVKDSSGNILNKQSRMNVTPVLIAADFELFINDAETAIAKDSKFTVTITMIDGKTVAGTTTVKAQAKAGAQTPATPPTQPVTPAKPSQKNEIALFESRGTGEQDLASEKEKIGGDGKNDYEFNVKLAFKDAAVKGMKLTAEAGGKKAVWDTVPGNNTPLLVLIDGSKNIVNKADGSITFTGKGEAVYSLLVSDKDGVLADSKVKAVLVITLGDGTMLEKEAVRGKKIVAKDSIVADYRGAAKYDFVGQSKKLESNMTPDRFISVTINAEGTLTGVKIQDTSNGLAWDTVSSSKNPIVAVMNPKGEKLNKADGTISAAVKGTTELHLAFDDEHDSHVGPYKVTMVFANGQMMEATTGKAATAAAEQPSATKEDRAVKFTSKKPAIVAVDLVGKNKKKGASGAKDTAVSVQITGKGNIKAMVLTDAAGKGWDTLASNNGRWLLGVREGSKFLNAKNGTVKITVNGTKTYQLVMQDNGKLKAKTGKLLLTTTWGDGEVTETEYKW